jgi:hypothetical protein
MARNSASIPFNFLPSFNAAAPHLDLRAPETARLTLKDGQLLKHFVEYDDRFYRLTKIKDLNGNSLLFYRSAEGVLWKIVASYAFSLHVNNDARGRRTAIVLIGIDGARQPLSTDACDAAGRMVSADCVFNEVAQCRRSLPKAKPQSCPFCESI